MNTQTQSLVRFLLFSLVAASAIACQPEEPIANTPPVHSPGNSISDGRGIYQSDRFDFQFSYPSDEFTIDETLTAPNNGAASSLATVDIWTKEHAQKIKSGAYEGGAEYPANVSITVSENPQNLSLRAWVEQSNQFSITRDFQDTTVAGQSAIAFQSSGLYENDHLVFANPDRSEIVTVTFSKIDYGNHDATYQKAFEQVKRSFTFVKG
ncbi:hypothetical protein [Geitlerinema calcuttense]|uniref:Lipoprotein n=1 Tax=Geitlerinema calcuttense NRMC-F 0142 TaxID=2922238 RepID=A0ABT7LWT9_9CYAN|nr:hypothetical protein [Geitlerinema calcuttense]MDL5056234.1 hypothetical protein [Geitlerinema calcuttense NRMC-F 0142]